MTSERRETVRGCHSYPTKSGSTHFISHDTRNIFHVVRGFLRCCTEGTKSTCPGTYGGRFHNGHGAIAVRYLLDQELNLAFRFFAVCPPPRVKTTRDKLERFLRYGKMLVRSDVPLIHHIDPMWTDPSKFRKFRIEQRVSASMKAAIRSRFPEPIFRCRSGASKPARIIGRCSTRLTRSGLFPTLASVQLVYKPAESRPWPDRIQG